MKGRTTLKLLITIVLLGLFIAGQEMWRARVPAKEFRRVRLFELDAESLVSLQFKYTNTVVECVKENGVWMTGDAERGFGRADVALLYRMVAGLNAMGKGTVITEKHLKLRGFNAGEYGFDQPALEIVALDEQGRHLWQVGRRTPLGDMVYVKEGDGAEIYTVLDKILEIAPVEPDHLRDRTVFIGEAPAVRRVEVRGPEGFVQMIKGPEGQWHIQQPESAAADEQAVDNYIEALYRLRAETFVAEKVSDFSFYGLKGDARLISLGGAGDASSMVVIGDEIPDRPGFVYARRADDTSVFALKSDVLQLLSVTSERFRDADLLTVEKDKITSVSVQYDGEHLDLQKDDTGQWQIKRPVAWKAGNAEVEELLQVWDHAVITEFDRSGRTLSAEWIFEFGSREMGKTNRIEVLPTGGSLVGLLVRRDGAGKVHRINLPMVADSMVQPLHFKDPEVWRIDPASVVRVELRGTARPAQKIERQEDGSYLLEDESGSRPAEPTVWAELLRRIEAMRTLEYVVYNPSDLAAYGLEQPELELHVGLDGTGELGRVLLVGRQVQQGYYAMVKGRDVVFFLESDLVEPLKVDLNPQQESALPGME